MPPTSFATSAPPRAGQGGSGGLRPATRADAQWMHELARAASARHGASGPMVPSVEALEGTLERDELIAYAVDGGFVLYDLSEQAVTVEHLVATTPEAAATLWGVVGSGSSAAPTVHTYLDPRDPVTLVLGGLPATEVRQVPWMGRVVDLAAAFGGRGFGPHSSVEVDLLVEDAEAPANSGRWTLAVSAGRGTATRADGPDGPGRWRAPGRGPRAVGAVVRMVRVAPAPGRARHGRHLRG